MAFTFIQVLYLLLLFALSLFALHRLYLAWIARTLCSEDGNTGQPLPSVVVQLPIFNEKHVAERVVRACAKLDYPRSQLEVQVLDDSDDETPQILAPLVESLRGEGLNIRHIRRANRKGYKAGALQHGLEQTSAEFVAIFDADFVPSEDFLTKLLPAFHNEKVGMVQARWEHLNAEQNLLTRAQRTLLDAHFLNEHAGRAAAGCFFNFNGTSGIWRRRCIEDAGGWMARTLTEDLDLSYRAQLGGWRFVYRPDVVVPAELPSDVDSFKAQQHRWAKGSIQVARFLLPLIWRSQTIGITRKFESTMHLLGNIAYPATILLGLIAPFVVLGTPVSQDLQTLMADSALFFAATGSLFVFYGAAAFRAGAWGRQILYLPWVLVIGLALAINNTRGIIEAALKQSSPFVRTPKLGKEQDQKSAPYLNFVQRDLPQSLLELLLGAYLFAAGLFAVYYGRYGATSLFIFFSMGFLVMGSGTLWTRSRLRRTV